MRSPTSTHVSTPNPQKGGRQVWIKTLQFNTWGQSRAFGVRCERWAGSQVGLAAFDITAGEYVGKLTLSSHLIILKCFIQLQSALHKKAEIFAASISHVILTINPLFYSYWKELIGATKICGSILVVLKSACCCFSSVKQKSPRQRS